MATTFKLKTLVQNTYAASSTKKDITQRIPDVVVNSDDYSSASMEITGADEENGFSHNATVLQTITGFSQKDPITGGALSVDTFVGFAIYVSRAASDTAPTGSPALTINDFAGITTDSDIALSENVAIVHHNPGADAISSGEYINIDMQGTTGYKISLLVWFEAA